MIYDGHAYCIQPPEQHGGFEDPEEFWRYLQLFMATARQQPVWRKRDGKPADSSGLVNPARPWSFDALREARFRIGDHGKVEWTVDGEDYVKQVLPPWVRNLTFTPESLIAEMDYAGVDMSLLHRTPYMSKSNEYIADCVRRFPDRIQGLAYVEEWLVQSEPDRSIEKLERAIKGLGLAGYQFLPQHMRLYGQTDDWDGPGFRPFWDAAANLDVPIFFTLGSGDHDRYLNELRRLRRWMERYPDVRVVQTHGFNWRLYADDERLCVPDEVFEASPIDSPNYSVQILFAVFLQSRWEYPMPQIRPTLEKMVERIGPNKLMWGTDIPVVLLHWTYRQSLDFIRGYCDFLNQDEMDLILGGNMARLMRVRTDLRRPWGSQYLTASESQC